MSHIFLFHGEDSYSANQKAEIWLKQFCEKFDELGTEILLGEETTVSKIMESVNTLPFLCDKKLIIIKNFFAESPTEELKKLADKLEQIPEHSITIFLERKKADSRTALFKKIKKIGQITEFPLLDRHQLTQWINTETRKHGGIISPSTSALLADTVGPDLWQMKQEIEKLCLHASGQQSALAPQKQSQSNTGNNLNSETYPNPQTQQNNQPSTSSSTTTIQEITPEAIESLVSPNLNTSIFKLTDYISQKNTRLAIKTLKDLIENGESLMQILFMIVRQIRILIMIKDCTDKNMKPPAITKKIKEHPFVISKGIPQTRNFTAPRLAQIHQQLLKIDTATKSGGIRISTDDQSELRLAMEKLIIQACG